MIDDTPADIRDLGGASAVNPARRATRIKISRSDRAFSTKNEFSFLKAGGQSPCGGALKFARVDVNNPKMLFIGAIRPANPIAFVAPVFRKSSDPGIKLLLVRSSPQGIEQTLNANDPVVSHNG
jgi:hypothetical protein